MFIDFYELLEIPFNATQEEIKFAYRKQCIKWHPDKNPDFDTTQRMQDINQAYLILKDEEARKRYDGEYIKFKAKFQKSSNEHSDTEQDEVNTAKQKSYSYSNYEFDDDILKKWMENAKKQAQKMAKDAIDEFKGASKDAGNSIIKYLLQIMIPMLIGFLLMKSCIN